MIAEVSIRCQKTPEVGIRRIPAYPPNTPLRVAPLLLLESINRRLHVSLQRTVSYTGQSRIPFQTLQMNPRKHTPRNEQ